MRGNHACTCADAYACACACACAHVRLDGATNPITVQANAALALACVCRGNKANQDVVADLGGLPQLSVLLRPANPQGLPSDAPGHLPGFVEAEAAGAIWALAEGHDANKVSIGSSGAVSSLSSLLGSTNEPAQRHATAALSSISYGQPDNQERVATLLVGLLSSTGDATQKRVAKALWRIARENPTSQTTIAKAGGAETLVHPDLLRTYIQTSTHACVCICMCTCACTCACALAGAETLVHLLRGSARRPSTAEAKAYALWSLSLCIDESNYATVVESGGIQPLVAALSAAGGGGAGVTSKEQVHAHAHAHAHV